MSDDPRILDQLEAAGIRCARIAPTQLLDRAPGTMMDDVAAAREIAEHVVGLGHRDVAIIKGDPTHPSSHARTRGYRAALEAAGITVPPNRIAQGYFTVDSGIAAAETLLAADTRPTAILAQNDDMAAGALLVAREHGLDVPGDLSVVGFDDSEVSHVTWPRITTIRQPVFDMAFASAEMLIAVLEGRAFDPLRLLPHELLVRGSTAPPRH